MLKILKNLKKSFISVILIILLLWIQAAADLALPDYTSKIVDTGIQAGGIEESVPQIISKEDMENILIFTKEGNTILNYYKLVEETQTNTEKKVIEKYFKKDFKINPESLYILEISKENEKDLKEVMVNPLIEVYSTKNKEFESKVKEQFIQNIPENQKNELQKLSIIEILKEIPQNQKEIIIDNFSKQIDTMSDSIKEQTAIASIKELYKNLGIDTNKLQNNYIITSGLQMLGVSLISMISAVLIMLLSSRVAAKLGKILREKIFKKVLSFSSKELREFSTASLITRSTNDIQQIQQLIAMMFRVVVYAPIIGLGGFLKVLTNSHNQMAWIIGVAILAILFIVGTLFLIAMPKFKKLQNLIDRLNQVSREILTGLPVIRAFNKEKKEEEKFEKANDDLMKNNIFVNKAMSLMMPLLTLIMNCTAVLIIWIGGQGVNDGIIQVGDMMAFIQYTMQIIISFLFISMLSIMLPRATVSANRINEVLDSKPNIDDKKELKTFDENKKGLVEFKNVSFRYPDADAEILSEISFTAKPGETTAIIGSTGSGKSTVINLIPRFYDVTGGELIIDGVNVKDVSQKELRNIIGYVPQKGILFSGTIESNIKYSNENMSDEKMIQAAQIAQATEFIEQKEDKYKSNISQGGSNVSGGQKQRLSIARAIAKDPEILIFDDSFSALDFKTDRKLREALLKNTKNKTVIIVAQRINTIMNAEKIVVLDEGKVVGIGTHEELMNNNEIYKNIALSQLSEEELFQKGGE